MLTGVELTRKQLSHCLKMVWILKVFPVSPRRRKALQATLGRDRDRLPLGRHRVPAGSRVQTGLGWAGLGWAGLGCPARDRACPGVTSWGCAVANED